jgi:hypothetical protein
VRASRVGPGRIWRAFHLVFPRVVGATFGAMSEYANAASGAFRARGGLWVGFGALTPNPSPVGRERGTNAVGGAPGRRDEPTAGVSAFRRK